MTIEITLAIIALGIASWQLKLQRDEVRRTGQINSYIHIASMIKEKIEHHEKIIQDFKTKKKDWTGHAYQINNKLKPLLASVNNSLMNTMSHQNSTLDANEVIQILKLKDI